MSKHLPYTLILCLLFGVGCMKKKIVNTNPSVEQTPEEKLVSISIRLTPPADTGHVGSDNIKTFRPRDTVHAVITSQNAGEGMLLTGRWFFLTNDLKLAENRTTLQNGTNITHFDLLRSQPWMPGEYKLIIYLDSTAKDSARFRVANK